MTLLKKRIFAIIFLIIGTISNAFSKDKIVFNNLSVRDGLSSHVIYSIESDDDDGFIWTISPNGIDRYDGEIFKHYLLHHSDSVKVGSLNIHSGLFTDSKGKLWVYSNYGVYYYNNELDRFDKFDLLNKWYPNKSSVYKIEEWRGKIIFFSWSNILIWNPDNNQVNMVELNSRMISFCEFNSKGALIGTKLGLQYLSDDNKIEEFKTTEFDLSDSRISALYKNTDNTIWVGTQNKGLFILKKGKLKQIRHADSYTIMSIIKFEGEILVATDGNGIMVFNDEGEFIEILNNFNSQLDATQIYDLHIDYKNRLWVSTYGKGIYYHIPNNATLHPYKKNLEIVQGYFAYEDTFGKLCLGTDNGVYFDADSDNPIHFVDVNLKGESITKNFVVNGIIQDNNQDYWISTYGYGLYLLEKNTYKIKKHISYLSIGNKEISIKFIHYINYIDGNVFIKIANGNILEFNQETGIANNFPLFNNVTFIYNNKRTGNFYVVTPDGVFSYKDKKKKFLFSSESLISDYLVINKDYGILGTETDGIILLDHNTKETSNIISYKALPQTIVDMLYVNDSTIILIGNNSVYKVELNLRESIVTSSQKLVNRFEANKNTSIIYKGKLILGGYESFIELPFSPIETKQKDEHQNIVFDELEIGGKLIVPGKNKVLPKRINLASKVLINYPHKDFKLRLSTPNYSNDILQYSWILKGVDEQFSDKTNMNIISYSNLPYGKYNLLVKCFSVNTKNEIAQKEIKIIVKPPFWGTIWAYILYFSILSVVIYIAFGYYLSLKKQRRLNERNKFFAELAHEIRTPLTLIKGPIQQLSELNTNDKSKKLLSGVSSNLDRLNNRLNQLLDYESVNKVADLLYATEFELISTLDNLISDFDPLLESRKIKLIKNYAFNELIVKLDKEKVDKIIYNLISNAVKYSNDNGTITLILNKHNDIWSLKVVDNGIGIPKKSQKHIFNRFYRAENALKSGIIGSGIGLILSYKYANLMGGELTFKSVENKETTFTLSLPIELIDSEIVSVPEDVSHYGEEYTKLTNIKYDYRIAIAEDNNELREFLKESLSENFIIETFENGAKCYESLKVNDYDLVLSDVMMPEMNGYELCDKIKGNIETSHLPIILLTALNASMYKAEGYEHGADHYIIKPFDIRMLKLRIVNLIKNRLAIKEFYSSKIESGEEIVTNNKLNSLDSKFLEKLDDLVTKNIRNHEYSVKDICIDLAMSRPVLYRKLKALTDTSPQDYIQNKRLAFVKKVLETSDESISNIAYDTGYSNPKYLSTTFKKKYGISPRDYIKKVKGL